MILFGIIILLFVLYSLLIIYYWLSWKAIPVFVPPPSTPRAMISVVVPARNEAENIGDLLNALKHQDYPASQFEIIVVDDHSTDKTADIVKQYDNVILISLKEDGINSYKKKAIEKGAALSHGTEPWHLRQREHPAHRRRRGLGHL